MRATTIRLSLVLAATVLMGAAGALAADRKSAEGGAMRRLELARQYLAASHKADDLINSYPEMVRLSKSACKTDACTLALVAAVKQATAEAAPAYFEGIARIWADTFTEKELKDSLAFVSSPSGQAMIAKAPLLIPGESALSVHMQEQVWERAGAYFCKAQPAECQSFTAKTQSES
ncbi:MAG: hypothetical protein JWP35_1540 [Caulobacter sp.]|nr:hypothetical protein [Caulobacter sp.]